MLVFLVEILWYTIWITIIIWSLYPYLNRISLLRKIVFKIEYPLLKWNIDSFVKKFSNIEFLKETNKKKEQILLKKRWPLYESIIEISHTYSRYVNFRRKYLDWKFDYDFSIFDSLIDGIYSVSLTLWNEVSKLDYPWKENDLFLIFKKVLDNKHWIPWPILWLHFLNSIKQRRSNEENFNIGDAVELIIKSTSKGLFLNKKWESTLNEIVNVNHIEESTFLLNQFLLNGLIDENNKIVENFYLNRSNDKNWNTILEVENYH